MKTSPHLPALVLAALIAGCTVAPSPSERQARNRMARVGGELRAGGSRPALPALTATSPLADYLRFAVLNHPKVEAAYLDWRAAVEAIAPARALPDPQLTFQADVWDTLMSFMPGIMFDFMSSKKRATMAREATAASGVEYRAFVSAVLSTAAETRKAWTELVFLDEAIRLRQASQGSLEQSASIAETGYATGSPMGTFESQIRLGNEIGKVRADLAILADRRVAARARFKSSLGLTPSEAEPAWPQTKLTASALAGADELWRRAQEFNPDLMRMRAMVEMATAEIEVARQTATPDFSLGGMVNLINSAPDPRMIRPVATLTLPIWREKIAATIAAANARGEAASARVSAETLDLAVELARMIAMVRESDRMIAYIDKTALPSLERLMSAAEVSYQTGTTPLTMIPETGLRALGMRTERLAALRERELAITDLMLLTADIVPPGEPLLTGAGADSATLKP